jgi:3-(3-hydroxy-phenyl)propionate hydroxylase
MVFSAALQARLSSDFTLTIICFIFALISFGTYIYIGRRAPPSIDEIKAEAETACNESHLPVLVVGAGPTGLTLATVLARYGVPVRIVEQKLHLSRHTKATNVMQRNQELISALGLLEELNNTGGQMRRLMVHAYGKKFGPRTMRLKETPFTDVVLCGQHNLEKVMANGLKNAGVEIEFGIRLTHVVQNGEAVTATLESAAGQEIASFSYLVGCDGHLGVTRKFTRLDFQTTQTGVAIRQVDCKLQWRRLSSMEQMWLFYFDHGFAVVIPLPEGIHRILCIEPKPCFPDRKPTLDEMQDKLRIVAKDDALTLTEPLWFSYTDLSMGLAPALQDKRILLAGDVGNPVLPNGGQGMNTGITDAFNLGWKLAAVHKHRAPSSLLHTYNVERHAVRSALQTAQYNSLKYTTLSTPKIAQFLFRLLAEPLLDLGGEYAMARTFSELTIHTRASPLSLNADRSIHRTSVRAGDRALDAATVQSFRPIQLYTLIYTGAWTLLAFSGRGSYSGTKAVSVALRALQLQRPDLRAYIVTTESATEDTAATLYDLDEEADRVYGLLQPALLLVRPDGHVGARVGLDGMALLLRYLERWVPDASQIFRRIET